MYKIYCEDKNKDTQDLIESVLQTRVNNYVIHECRGYSNGQKYNNTLVIDLFGVTKQKEAEFLAEIITEVTEQDLVVVIKTDDTSAYVKRPVSSNVLVN